MIAKHTKYVIIVCLILSTIKAQTNKEDECLLENGKVGKCKLIENCPSAIEIIRNKGKPVHCGFDGTRPIVCCEVQNKVGDISKQKCMEYKPPAVFIPVSGSNLQLSDLEQNNLSHRIRRKIQEEKYNLTINISKVPLASNAVGGVDAHSFEFPHMAALGYGKENDITWLCGGSLISEKYVLTAAHCINSLDRGPVKFVRLGDLNLKLTTDDAKPQNFKVARSIIHPGYKSPSVYNDIALIELSAPALINRYVLPACLQTETNITQEKWGATGWGLTSFGGSPADHLQNVALRPFTWTKCQEVYASTPVRKLKNGIDDKTQICAGELNKDTCQGDSGGPLHVQREDLPWGHYTVIGVTSFGKACGLGENPAVYTRVSYYIDWIESIVWTKQN